MKEELPEWAEGIAVSKVDSSVIYPYKTIKSGEKVTDMYGDGEFNHVLKESGFEFK